MFPTMFTLGIAGLGPLTGDGSGLLIMAIFGGAAIPVLQGIIADRIGAHHAFILPLICYLYVAYYGLIGSKIRHVRASSAVVPAMNCASAPKVALRLLVWLVNSGAFFSIRHVTF